MQKQSKNTSILPRLNFDEIDSRVIFCEGDEEITLSAPKHRVYPKPVKEMRLKRSLLSLCLLYSKLRAKKIEEHKENNVSLTETALRGIALKERHLDSELQLVYSQFAQAVADRVCFAFQNFLQGWGRFPKDKQPRKRLSMTYPQSGFKINPDEGLYLSKIGYVRIFIHRPLAGRVKMLIIKLEAGECYAIFITERETPAKQSFQALTTDRIRGLI